MSGNEFGEELEHVHVDRLVTAGGSGTCQGIYAMARVEDHQTSAVEDVRSQRLELRLNSSMPLRPQSVCVKRTLVRQTAEAQEEVANNVAQLMQVELTKGLREYLKKTSFDNWKWDDAEMIYLMRQMFIDLNLTAKFHIEMPTLMEWLMTVYKNYNDVPFHNFKHGFMVCQMMYGLIWLTDLQNKLDDVDILILMVSAICHDLDHPGYNNAYQINARTELALRYNDMSPLENHHCARTFIILENKSCNILANLEPHVYKRVREGTIRCIMATDMARHNDILKAFEAIIPICNFTLKEHKDIVMEILIKCADISNECRPTDVSAMWLDCLLEEYFMQSDTEKKAGLPVAPFMDRDKVTKPSSQIGFLQYCLVPLFESLGNLFPVVIPDVVEPVKNALEHYTKMQETAEQERKRREEQGQE